MDFEFEKHQSKINQTIKANNRGKQKNGGKKGGKSGTPNSKLGTMAWNYASVCVRKVVVGKGHTGPGRPCTVNKRGRLVLETMIKISSENNVVSTLKIPTWNGMEWNGMEWKIIRL